MGREIEMSDNDVLETVMESTSRKALLEKETCLDVAERHRRISAERAALPIPGALVETNGLLLVNACFEPQN